MEALAAIGLASNIAQFVGYAIKFIKTTSELSKSGPGTMKEHQDFENLVGDMLANLGSIKGTTTNSRNELGRDETLFALAQSCLQVSTELQAIFGELAKVKQPGIAHVLESAFRALSRRREIQELIDRLSNLRGQISHHLIVQIRCVLRLALLLIPSDPRVHVASSNRNWTRQWVPSP